MLVIAAISPAVMALAPPRMMKEGAIQSDVFIQPR
jgi:hypothetical protein